MSTAIDFKDLVVGDTFICPYDPTPYAFTKVDREETVHHVQHMINRCYSSLKAIPISIIDQMSPTARKIVADSLRKEADRYAKQ